MPVSVEPSANSAVSATASPPARPAWLRGRTLALAIVALGAFLLCASIVVAATGAGLAAPTVSAEAERTMQGAKVSLQGTGWPARTELTITGTAPPGAKAPLDLGTSRSNAEGEFRATKLSKCTTSDATSAKVTITVKTGEQSATAQLDAASWVCMS